MNRVYIMVVESLYDDSRKQFKSLTQGATPPGYRLVGVCGFFDSPKSRKELKEELYHDNCMGQNHPRKGNWQERYFSDY